MTWLDLKLFRNEVVPGLLFSTDLSIDCPIDPTFSSPKGHRDPGKGSQERSVILRARTNSENRDCFRVQFHQNPILKGAEFSLALGRDSVVTNGKLYPA